MKNHSARKKIAFLLLTIQLIELLSPLRSYALMSGPSQPEVQSFEPVTTTQTVDPFTGDFTYNIPLMDVEGYPVNISYHSGTGMEDEASWVGVGWNINPGSVNRTVRGIPDDFKGEEIKKTINIEPEKTTTLSGGISLKPEIFGKELPVNLSLGATLGFNNYKGVSAGVNAGLTTGYSVLSGGLGFSANSQDGADVNVSASIGAKLDNQNGGFSANIGTGFNTRTGLKSITYEVAASYSVLHPSYGSFIPVGLQNYVSVVTNASHMQATSVQLKFGAEIYGGYPAMQARADHSVTTTDENGTRNAYGYLYEEFATKKDITDFSREKDGMYNKTLSYLPSASLTYDVYAVTGQGTGGMFRPFRNDIGTVYDPYMSPTPGEQTSVEVEYGAGGLVEAGVDVTTTKVDVRSGPWDKIPFIHKQKASLFENVYFKQGGEQTKGNVNTNNTFWGANTFEPQYIKNNNSIYGRNKNSMGTHTESLRDTLIIGNKQQRIPRATHIGFLTNKERDAAEAATNRKIISYNNGRSPEQTNRTITHKDHQIGEVTQTLPDGRRYIYGVPALNNVTRETVFNVPKAAGDFANGIADYSACGEDGKHGRDKFRSATITPSYAHSFLLTGVLSADYVDVLGDGITNDDLGTATKFSYNKWSSDYRWKSPYYKDDAKNEKYAQYNPGYLSDYGDDKAQYIAGSKELWHLSAIEGRNQIAIFYTSKREDALGAKSRIEGTAYSNDISNTELRKQFKLDSIALFYKNDYIQNQSAAVPVKTVIFQYNYELCPNSPNSIAPGKGKLTLKSILSRYGRSQKSLLSPYKFTYANNYAYEFAAKNRWGGYKPLPAPNKLSNWEFPYINQTDPDNDQYAAAYQLSEIALPSGGTMKIAYESDDYSYVQDKRAMQMLKIEGIGRSENYLPLSELYEHLDNQHQYVYFSKNPAIPAARYLEDQQYLYYSFNINLPNITDKFEQIRGYAKVESIGNCTGDNTHGYIKLKLEDAGGKSDRKLNPATLMALNTGRFYIPHVIYPGFKDFNETGANKQTAKDVLNALAYAGGELLTLAKNANVRFVESSKAKYINIEKSFIRLHLPGYTKKGGGSRVRKITLDDEWTSIAGAGAAKSTYGQEFFYTEDGTPNTPSSGVASYEPFIGGDENPLRQPVPYTADADRMMPPVQFFQELPLSESLYPPASVGYSKVTVRSIHFNEGQSTQNENVSEYFTARDFPVITDFTDKDVAKNEVSKSYFDRKEEVNVLQGYAVRLNDMHGKLKSTTNYLVLGDNKKETITSTSYKYKTNSKGELDNKVKAVVLNAAGNNEIQDCNIGVEADITIDSRQQEQYTTAKRVQPNLNSFMVFVVYVVIPTLFMPAKHDNKIFKTKVTTKVIQQYGILESVTTVDHGAANTVENVLFDSESGNVLLTRRNNEYNDNNYNLTIPAYYAKNNSGMGPAYRNAGYTELPEALYVDGTGGPVGNDNYLNGYIYTDNIDKYEIGDELLVELSGADHVNFNYDNYDNKKVKVWVTGKTQMSLPEKYTAMPHYGDLPWEGVTDGTVNPVCNYLLSHPGETSFTRPLLSPAYTLIPTSGPPRLVLVVRPRTKYVMDNAAVPAVKWIDNLKTVTAADVTLGPLPASGPQLILCPPEINNRTYTINLAPLPPYSASEQVPKIYKDFQVTILRSGRHNQLSDPLTEVTFHSGASSRYTPATYSGLLSDPLIYNNLLTASASRYSDNLSPGIDGFNNKYLFNSYVLGQKGIYRSSEVLGPLVDRNYKDAATGVNLHNRVAGKFALSPYISYSASGIADLTLNAREWKPLKTMVKYSPYGILLEDMDNNNVHSTAQLGYNNSLVTAVTYNAEQYESLFESFEDLKGIYSRVFEAGKGISDWRFSPFKSLFTYNAATASLPVTAEQVHTIADNVLLTTSAHTGNYALQVGSGGLQVGLSITDRLYSQNVIYPFSFQMNRDYIVSVWATAQPGNINGTPFVAKTAGAIEGWTQYEAVIKPGFKGTLYLNLNPGIRIDDVRIMPKKANMKSFVFDAMTFRLMAALDENHYATFFEYDQEGQMVRTKKETERGIITIQESRKATRKLK